MLLDFFAGQATVLDILIWIFCAFLCLTIHEVAHGFTAYKLGDPTAKNMGRLTLNPIPHIDIIGLLAILIFRFGWAKPVPVDPRNFTSKISMRNGMALTAFAGPLSNLLFAFISLFTFTLLINFNAFAAMNPTVAQVVQTILSTLITLNIALAIFNLLPVPPLDGSKIVSAVLPDRMLFKYMRIERFGFIVLILALNLPIFRGLLGAIMNYILRFYLWIIGLLPFM